MLTSSNVWLKEVSPTGLFHLIGNYFTPEIFYLTKMHSLFKVSANPKLTLLHNFGFLYDLRNIRNSFRLEKNPQKCYSYGKLLSENNSAILIILISRWQLLSSRCQIRRGHVTAKHMCVCVSQNHAISNLGSSQSHSLEKEKNIISLFIVKAKT